VSLRIPTTNAPTPRELEVLRLICEGMTSKEIAARLRMSVKTVLCHRYRLMDKAQAQNGIMLFRWALKNGYVSVD
jgi:DNA-binding NarL/FixJ family response regulator